MITISELYLGTMHSGKSMNLKKSYDFTKQMILPNSPNAEIFYFTPKLVNDQQKEIEIYCNGKFTTDGSLIENRTKLAEAIAEGKNLYVFIDEVQFLSGMELLIMHNLTEKSVKNKCFVNFRLAGLEFDYLNREFPVVSLLKKYTYDQFIMRFTTKCECCGNETATHNSLFRNGRIVLSESENGVFDLETDSKPKYRVICDKCYEYEKNKNRQPERINHTANWLCK